LEEKSSGGTRFKDPQKVNRDYLKIRIQSLRSQRDDLYFRSELRESWFYDEVCRKQNIGGPR
jgi:hypothetical protein